MILLDVRRHQTSDGSVTPFISELRIDCDKIILLHKDVKLAADVGRREGIRMLSAALSEQLATGSALTGSRRFGHFRYDRST